MTPLVTTIIIAIIAAAIGVVVTVVIHRSSAKNRARQIVADAERQALDIKKDKEIEGREEALKITAEAEKAANQRMSKIQSMEAKQKQRELQLNQQQGENARTRNELEAARQTLDEQYQAVEPAIVAITSSEIFIFPILNTASGFEKSLINKKLPSCKPDKL